MLAYIHLVKSFSQYLPFFPSSLSVLECALGSEEEGRGAHMTLGSLRRDEKSSYLVQINERLPTSSPPLPKDDEEPARSLIA